MYSYSSGTNSSVIGSESAISSWKCDWDHETQRDSGSMSNESPAFKSLPPPSSRSLSLSTSSPHHSPVQCVCNGRCVTLLKKHHASELHWWSGTEQGALTQYLMEEEEEEGRGGMVEKEMQTRAELKSDCTEEKGGVKMRGRDGGGRG